MFSRTIYWLIVMIKSSHREDLATPASEIMNALFKWFQGTNLVHSVREWCLEWYHFVTKMCAKLKKLMCRLTPYIYKTNTIRYNKNNKKLCRKSFIIETHVHTVRNKMKNVYHKSILITPKLLLNALHWTDWWVIINKISKNILWKLLNKLTHCITKKLLKLVSTHVAISQNINIRHYTTLHVYFYT